ncbi:MAG: hypothetical protein QOE51_1681, partial [Actinoplanes sp.]|nr:hypothetical protein [Actinoplanes sp.]
MSQDEFRRTLPGNADFELPAARTPRQVNGHRPVPPREQPEPAAVDLWDQRVAN